MKDKYYTPEIEDLFIGYESTKLRVGEYKTWYEPYIIESVDGGYGIKCWPIGVDSITLRTKYLDKEDIESLGFILKHKSIDYWFELSKEHILHSEFNSYHGAKAYKIFLNYGFHDHRLNIRGDFDGGITDASEASCIFEGECKSINELRKIMKMLKIS